MANLTLMEKLRRKHKTPTAEVLDKTPLAIIAGTRKRPQTLADSIDYILRSNYDIDAYDRLRGAEFDDLGENEDDVPQIDESDFDTDIADYDAGHFDKYEFVKVTPKGEIGQPNAPQKEDAPRKGSSDQDRVGVEPSLPLLNGKEENDA